MNKIGIGFLGLVFSLLIASSVYDTITRGKYQSPISSRYTLQEQYKVNVKAVVLIKTPIGIGTGFFINETTIVTANHVVKGFRKVDVYLYGSKSSITGTVVNTSDDLDVAVIKIQIGWIRGHIRLSKDQPQVGDAIYVIGHPYGLMNTLTSGIVSHNNRKMAFSDISGIIQIDAPINGGNSGGPVFNRYGEVIGLISYGVVKADGLGFIIPIKYIRAMAE